MHYRPTLFGIGETDQLAYLGRRNWTWQLRSQLTAEPGRSTGHRIPLLPVR